MNPSINFMPLMPFLQNNDLKSLMKTIEEGLHNLHSQARETAMDAESSTEIDKRQEVGVPFARVMAVVDNSPAHSAGLKQGDLVIKFGSVIKVIKIEHLQLDRIIQLVTTLGIWS